jgi:hypothetical protein
MKGMRYLQKNIYFIDYENSINDHILQNIQN